MTMATEPNDPFTPEVVSQIIVHMNDDHAADNLLIVRWLGAQRDAERAVMSGMDCDGIEFTATVAGHQMVVRLPWSRRLTERAEVRVEVVRLHEQAVLQSERS